MALLVCNWYIPEATLGMRFGNKLRSIFVNDKVPWQSCTCISARRQRVLSRLYSSTFFTLPSELWASETIIHYLDWLHHLLLLVSPTADKARGETPVMSLSHSSITLSQILFCGTNRWYWRWLVLQSKLDLVHNTIVRVPGLLLPWQQMLPTFSPLQTTWNQRAHKTGQVHT